MPLAALRNTETWVFDLDNTLYPADCNLFAQIDQRMGEFVSRRLGLTFAEAKTLQKQLFFKHGTTLRGLMSEYGIAPQAFLDYVHEIDLSPLPDAGPLAAALADLPGRKVIFTNGTVRHAERVTAALGIAEHFEGVFDIVASDYVPKPSPEPYAAMLAHFEIDPAGAVMVEDIAKNLAPARAMGMRTVWVPGNRAWSRDADDGAHIDHVVDDLVAWLGAVVAGVADQAAPG